MEATTRNLVSSSPSFPTKTHLKNGFSSPSSVVMLHEQTATPVINSRHLASLSRHFPASVLSQEPREVSSRPPPPLSHSLREDRTSSQQVLVGECNVPSNKKFEQQLLQSAGLWNLLMSPVTSEKHLPTVEDAVALAQKALSASKQAALLVEDSETVSSLMTSVLVESFSPFYI